MEKHIQTFIATILTAICIYISSAVVELKEQVSLLALSVEYLKNQVTELRTGYYSKEVIDLKLSAQDERIDALEEALNVSHK